MMSAAIELAQRSREDCAPGARRIPLPQEGLHIAGEVERVVVNCVEKLFAAESVASSKQCAEVFVPKHKYGFSELF